MLPEGGPHRRRAPVRHQKKCFLIVCPEGLAEAYFHWLTGVLDHQVVSRIVGYPQTDSGPDIIQRAAMMRTEARRKGAAFDEVWVVLEVQSLAEQEPLAILSARNRVRIARISPCFERWPLSHLAEVEPGLVPASEHRANAEALLPRVHDTLGLDLTFEPLLGRYSDAKARSEANGTGEMIDLVEAIDLSWRRFTGETNSTI